MTSNQSLGVAALIARWLFVSSMSSGCRATSPFVTRADGQAGDTSQFRKAAFEIEGFRDFFRCFPRWDVERELRGAVVLDFGCGYGGKTVEYAVRCGAERVCGIEPFPDVIDQATAFARARAVANVDFRVCEQLRIPYDTNTFDCVLTMDVLEHVENPFVSLKEIHRVLKPGGRAFVVFPPYEGVMSHHLDYISLLPGLHWMFSPHTLVRAVNHVLAKESGSQLSVKQQPPPRLSWDADRYVLPSLNGLTGTKFARMAGELFEVESLEWAVLGRNHRSGWRHWTHTALKPFTWWGGALRDAVSASVVAVLRKRAA
jgi:SAM-dependent methyltransferase